MIKSQTEKVQGLMELFDFASLPFDVRIFPSKCNVYIVGGSARDLFLGRNPIDYDICVSEKPEDFAAHVARNTGGHTIIIGKNDKKVFRVVTPFTVFDITECRGPNIESDLFLRDFTINAMCFHLPSGRLLDPLGGREDLEKKTVKRVSDTVFRDDPIRLLRAYRMSASLGFTIAQETIDLIQRDADLVQRTAGERIHEELFKILEVPDSCFYLTGMSDTGLLFSMIPELKPLCGCQQNGHHCHDVFTHTLAAYEHLENWMANRSGSSMSAFFPDSFHLEDSLLRLLKFALLLHDIGKPICKSRDEKGHIHFYGHEKSGAELSRIICNRFRCSEKELVFIRLIIALHSRPRLLYHSDIKPELFSRATTRLFLSSEKTTPYLLLHAGADMLGKGNTPEHAAPFLRFLAILFHRYVSHFSVRKTDPPVLTGRDLIHVFGLSPSPLFKKILRRLEEERLSSDQMNREAALSYVARLIKAL